MGLLPLRHDENSRTISTLLVGVPVVTQRVKKPTSIIEDVGSTPGLDQWVKDQHDHKLQCSLLWLRCRLAATAPI